MGGVDDSHLGVETERRFDKEKGPQGKKESRARRNLDKHTWKVIAGRKRIR